jgi:hypothetical protein
MAEDLRLARLSAKLKESALKPKELTDAEEYKRQQEGYETEEEAEGAEPVAEDKPDGEKGASLVSLIAAWARTMVPARS